MPDMCNDAYLKCLTNVGGSFLRLSEMYHIVNGVETWPSYQPPAQLPAQLPANIRCVIKSWDRRLGMGLDATQVTERWSCCQVYGQFHCLQMYCI